MNAKIAKEGKEWAATFAFFAYLAVCFQLHFSSGTFNHGTYRACIGCCFYHAVDGLGRSAV
jgi:hypothetical protein